MDYSVTVNRFNVCRARRIPTKTTDCLLALIVISSQRFTAVNKANFSKKKWETRAGVNVSTVLWGFADTQTHQFANLAFGGRFVWGDVFHSGGIEKALPWCDFVPGSFPPATEHGPGGIEDHMGDLMTAFLRVKDTPGHLVGGYPQFDGWPRWNSITHQQMYYEWLKRAYDGKVFAYSLCKRSAMKSCAVWSAMYSIATTSRRSTGNCRPRGLCKPSLTSKAVGKAEAGTGSSAHPQEAREAIYKGQLAVVLGIEVANLFGCARSPQNCSETYVRTQLDKYYEPRGAPHFSHSRYQ